MRSSETCSPCSMTPIEALPPELPMPDDRHYRNRHR